MPARWFLTKSIRTFSLEVNSLKFLQANFFSSDFFKHALIDSGLKVVCIFYGTGEGKATKKPQFIIETMVFFCLITTLFHF
jgi:hypothetical protein